MRFESANEFRDLILGGVPQHCDLRERFVTLAGNVDVCEKCGFLNQGIRLKHLRFGVHWI